MHDFHSEMHNFLMISSMQNVWRELQSVPLQMVHYSFTSDVVSTAANIKLNIQVNMLSSWKNVILHNYVILHNCLNNLHYIVTVGEHVCKFDFFLFYVFCLMFIICSWNNHLHLNYPHEGLWDENYPHFKDYLRVIMTQCRQVGRHWTLLFWCWRAVTTLMYPSNHKCKYKYLKYKQFTLKQ